MKQLSRHRGIAPIHYIPNGTHLPDSISNEEERDCYLYIGRIDIYQKGLDLLFEALRIVKERGVSIPRLIVAGPDYRGGAAFLEEFRNRHQLHNLVEFRGIVQGQEKNDLFKRARLFIHTSRWEGLPLVLLESLGFGVPCLLTPGTNVASEWASAGCAFETSELPSEIADRLICLSNYPMSEFSSSARSLAENEYSWKNITKQILKVYNSIIVSNEI
jgi:glycosyltransferase involved in cell wall biosynthesis